MGAGDERAHGRQPEVGVDGERVGGDRRVGAEKRFRVGIVGRPDVAPLGVDDHEETRARVRLGGQPLQGSEASPAMALVEGRLELDQSNGADGGVEGDVGEPVEAVRRVADSPRVEDGPRGVEAPR